MNTNEVKQVVQSIERSFHKTVKATKEDETGKIYKITLPFLDRAGKPFYLWAFQYPKSKHIMLSDARMLTREIGKEGTLQLHYIQKLVSSYGLSLMEDLSIMETSKRPLVKRVTAFLQALVGVDGVLRMWELAKNQQGQKEKA